VEVVSWRLLAVWLETEARRKATGPVISFARERRRLKYFVLLAWADERVVGIRDFVFARYAMDGADLASMD
jgi:hypothetical protein